MEWNKKFNYPSSTRALVQGKRHYSLDGSNLPSVTTILSATKSEEDKAALYQVPYQNMVQFMFEMPNEQAFNSLYDKLKAQGTIFFLSTSFLRGLTFDNALIIVDECQNLNFHELDTIITRVGQDSRIVFCGDFSQSDLVKQNERNGLHDFLRILQEMDEFNCTEFNIGDIVRSGFVKSYIINKIKLGIGEE